MSKSDNTREKEEEEESENSLPFHLALIFTPTPEDEIWHEIDSLTNYHYVYNLLNVRARGKHFSRFRQRVRDKLVKSKTIYKSSYNVSSKK